MPKITAGTVVEHRAQVRARIFAAFTELIADRGYEAITMADLAERAGIGRTSIYHHFRDPDAVVVAFATEETERYLDRLGTALAAADGPAERMRVYLRQHLALREEFHFGFGPELFGMLSGASLMQIREHVVAAEAVLRDLLADGVRAGVFAVEDEAAAVSMVHGCLQRRDVCISALEELVLRGLGA